MSGREVERGTQRRRFLRAVGHARDDPTDDRSNDFAGPATIARAVSARVGRAVLPRDDDDADEPHGGSEAGRSPDGPDRTAADGGLAEPGAEFEPHSVDDDSGRGRRTDDSSAGHDPAVDADDD